MKIIPFLLFILSFWSCHKEMFPIPPLPPPPDTIATKLKILWQVPIASDTSEYYTSPEAFVNGNIVFSTNFAAPSAYIQMRGGETGQLLWKFDNFIKPIDGFTEDQIFGLNGKIVVNHWVRTYCLSAENGQLDWSIDVSGMGGGEPGATTIGDYVYKSNYTGSKPRSISESVVRAHYLQGIWDTLLTITAEDSFYLNIYPPTLWINPQGDSILILRDNGLRDVLATPWEGRYNLVNLHAWNMRTREYEWQIKDFLDNPTISYRQPIIDGNRMYLMTNKILHCLDLPTGNVLWSRELPQGIGYANIVMHENFIIAQGSNNGMWAVDKINGVVKWSNSLTIGSTTKISYFEGVVYYTSTGSNTLWAVNAQNGEIIWKEFSPNALSPRTPNAGFDFANVIIDPVRRVLYTADRYYMMCIKLPE
jgi:outer membrane protein assembly factor BamB